jgi:adenine/guanine phosphoribosyltransferase-like PRPP-binding protein
VHEDAVAPGDRLLVVEDMVATGGTARAVGDLCEALGARVSGFAFLVEPTILKGRDRLAGREARSSPAVTATRRALPAARLPLCGAHTMLAQP